LRGKLIALEGTDAVGKFTQANLLTDKLAAAGKKVLYLDFPTYDKTPYGQIVKDYLEGKHGKKEETSAYVASMLFATDRMQFRDRIINALKVGTYLVCDRYKASNAYQIAKEPEAKWREFFDWLQRLESPLPDADATVWLDVPPETFNSRRKKDHYETDVHYQNRTRKVYQWMSDFLPIIKIEGLKKDGTHKPKDEVANEIWKELQRRGMV